MTQNVFISYSQGDKEFARKVQDKLPELLGIFGEPLKIFDVQSEIGAGEDIRESIQKAIGKSDTVVIVTSPMADASEFVNYEAGFADALGKKLVLVARKGSGKSAMVNRLTSVADFLEIEVEVEDEG